jgi:hypothetical protein
MKDGVEVKNGVDGLRKDMDRRFEIHDKQHKEAEESRVNGRRWLIGIGVAVLALMLSMGGLIIDILFQIHQ